MSDTQALAHQVLQDAYLAALGTVDAQGPWVANVIYVADGSMNLYWMSKETTRHSQSIQVGGTIAVAIIAEWLGGKERALQMEGRAEKLDGVYFDLEKQLRTKQGKPLPSKPGESQGGHSWYKFTPSRIELIHTEQFGWERKRVL